MIMQSSHTNTYWRQREEPCHDPLSRAPEDLSLPDLAEKARQRRDTNLEMEDCAK